MDKQELIDFLKDNLKVRVDTSVCGGTITVKVDLHIYDHDTHESIFIDEYQDSVDFYSN